MSWDSEEIKEKIAKGLFDLHIAVNRTPTDKLIQIRAGNLIPIFERWEPKHVEKFFVWMRENYDKIPSDREIKLCAAQQKVVVCQENPFSGSYYDHRGVLIPQGTYETVGTCSAFQWALLASQREKELGVKAKHSLLVGPEILEWDEICDKKFARRRGPIQKPQTEWNTDDWDEYGKFADSIHADIEKWAKYERELLEKQK